MNQKRSVTSTQVTEWKNGEARRTDDFLAGEEPLEMRIGNRAYGVTMRTTGNDRELVAGFLFTEGVISCREQLLELDVDQDASSMGNVIQIRLAPEANIPDGETRGFSAGSACGVCGKASIERIRNRNIGRPESGTRFEPAMLCTLPENFAPRSQSSVELAACMPPRFSIHTVKWWSCARTLDVTTLWTK
ncbi:MAG TPA: formate dehydrogenase accessory sulfurtransferase FdhD [Candidatus Acidoferrales bacterium]|jgi:FdhD protein|nr:formate dehydrogenase accessory sulfurtransferase FdhD [Candidatus Acidoferrales bacterium]